MSKSNKIVYNGNVGGKEFKIGARNVMFFYSEIPAK